MNRKLLLFCAASLPIFLLATIVQAVQFQDLERDVVLKERQQAAWVEKNKKVLAGVTVLSSPGRIEDLAQKDPGLESVGPEKTLKVRFQSGQGESR